MQYVDPSILLADLSRIKRLIAVGDLKLSGSKDYHPCVEAVLMRIPLRGALRQTPDASYYPSQATDAALSALVAYSNDEFPLPSNSVCTGIAGLRFSELPAQYQNYLESQMFTLLVVPYTVSAENTDAAMALIVAAQVA